MILRVTMSDAEWRYFERLRDRVRQDPDVAREVPADAAGTRLVLRTWLEEAIREATTLDRTGENL